MIGYLGIGLTPETLAEALDTARGCTLCKSRSAPNKALFVPTEKFSRRIGAPKGKLRVLTYALCEPCSQLPGVVELVEIEILKRLAVQ
jgi:hypothetical protein